MKKLKIYPEFTDEKQKAIALFYDKSQKSRQDIMILHPSSLTAVNGSGDEDLDKVNFQNAPIFEPKVANHLVDVLNKPESEIQSLSASGQAAYKQKQSQILKILTCQIELIG